MTGEGLGHHLNESSRNKPLSELSYETVTSDTGTVVSVGDVIIDRVIDLGDPAVTPFHDQWEKEPWFPAAGESQVVEEVPAYVDELSQESLPGGRGPNQAVAAARSGADTTFFGTAGTGDGLQYLNDANVNLDAVSYNAAGNDSTAYVFVDDTGENRITLERGKTPDAAYINDVEENITVAEYVLMNNGEPDDVLQATFDRLESTEEQPAVIFDPAPADGAERWLDYDCVDIVTPNEIEYETLREELENYDGAVIRTGAGGATLTDGDDTYHIPSPDVNPVDTTGAGDTFNGYLAGCLSQDMELGEAVEYAVHAASLSVTRNGAQPGVPSFEAVDAFMEGEHP